MGVMFLAQLLLSRITKLFPFGEKWGTIKEECLCT